MKHHLGSVFLFACCIALGNHAEAVGSGGIFVNSGADGAIELSNLSSGPDNELLIAAPEPAATPTNAHSPSSASTSPVMSQSVESHGLAESSKAVEQQADASEMTHNERYRNQIMQQVQSGARPNPAVSRRYLMQTRQQMAAFGQ